AGLPNWEQQDVLVARGFRIAGRIKEFSFSVAGIYGSMELKPGDVRTAAREIINSRTAAGTARVTGECMATGVFVSLGLRVEKGDEVFVSASGSIQYGGTVCTPDGANNRDGQMVWGAPIFALVARIGERGMPCFAGSKSSFIAGSAGVVQLGI